MLPGVTRATGNEKLLIPAWVNEWPTMDRLKKRAPVGNITSPDVVRSLKARNMDLREVSHTRARESAIRSEASETLLLKDTYPGCIRHGVGENLAPSAARSLAWIFSNHGGSAFVTHRIQFLRCNYQAQFQATGHGATHSPRSFGPQKLAGQGSQQIHAQCHHDQTIGA